MEEKKSGFEQYHQIPESKYSIVFFGKTGAGKSSILNNLQSQKQFKEGDSLESETREVEWHVAPFKADQQAEKVLFIDTPGFSDSEASRQQTLLHKMINFIKLIRNGFNFFFFLIPLTENRIDSSMQASLKILGSLFGDQVYQKTRIVFTHINQIRESKIKQKMDMFFQELPLKLRTLNINIPSEYFMFDYDNQENGGLLDLIACVKKSQKFCPQILEEVEKFIDTDFSDPAQLINELMSNSKSFNKAVNQIHNLNDLVDDLNTQNKALDNTVQQLRSSMKNQDQRNKELTDRIQKMRAENMEIQAEKDKKYMEQFMVLNQRQNQQLMRLQQESMKQQAETSKSTNEAILSLEKENSKQILNLSQAQQSAMKQQNSETMGMMKTFVQKSESQNALMMQSYNKQIEKMSGQLTEVMNRKPVVVTETVVERRCNIF